MTLRANLRSAEQLLADLEADLGHRGFAPGNNLGHLQHATALEILDLYYLRWLTQRIIYRLRAKARQRSGATRRDLTPCQDHYGYRKLGA